MKYRKLSLIIAASLATLVSGCSSSGLVFDYGAEGAVEIQNRDPSEQKKALAMAENCCHSLAEIDYKSVDKGIAEKNKPYDFSISSANQAFLFDSGKSYVLGVELPKAEGDIKLTVSSAIISSVFVPSILVLDADYHPVRMFAQESIVYDKASLFNADRYYGEVTIQEQDNARYLVVFTTDSAMASETELAPIDHQALESGNANAAKRIYMQDLVPHSATGVVRLVLDYTADTRLSNSAAITHISNGSKTVVSPNLPGTEVGSESMIVDIQWTKEGQLSEQTETQFIDSIQQAVKQGDLNKAMSMVEKAESFGSKNARKAFISALQNKL